MKMKSKLYAFALTGMVAVSSLMSAAAFAYDGEISITGAITASSCAVKGAGANGVASTNGDVTVDLGKISTKTLSVAKQTAGFKGFSIQLTGCTALLAGAVKPSFDVGPNVDPVSGRLTLTGGAGAATNVQLELRNGDGTVIKVGDDSSVKGVTVAAAATGPITMQYSVGYYATAPAGAGTANSSVTYSLVYP